MIRAALERAERERAAAASGSSGGGSSVAAAPSGFELLYRTRVSDTIVCAAKAGDTLLAAADVDGWIHLVDTVEGRLAGKCSAGDEAPNALVYVGSKIVSCGDDGIARVFEPSTGAELLAHEIADVEAAATSSGTKRPRIQAADHLIGLASGESFVVAAGRTVNSVALGGLRSCSDCMNGLSAPTQCFVRGD